MQAEDLVQEVFARFWHRRDRLQVHTSLGAYLHRMTVNEAISYLRKQKKWQTEELDPARESGSVVAPSGEEQLAASDLQQQIDRALQRLPLRCRTVFLLSRKDRLSYKEIAEQLEISVKTVENQMGKALRIMREELNEYL